MQQRYNSHVITRQTGFIPNCMPVVDTFIDRSPEEVRAMLTQDPYHQVWDDYRNGVLGWNEWLNHPIHKRKPYSPIR